MLINFHSNQPIKLNYINQRYKAALDVMIPMLRHESKGRRRDLLHQQVQFSK
jgi:hypothetical protein